MEEFVFTGLRDHAGRAYAVVLDLAHDGTSLVTTLRVSEPPGTPLVPSALWQSEPNREVLQFHRVRDEFGSRLILETFDFAGSVPEHNREYYLQLWWTPEAMDLVTDTTRSWVRARHPDDDRCDWCPLTYEYIGPGREEKEGYVSGDVWITIDAYNKYIRDDFLRVRN